MIFKDKTVIITGGSEGVGAATAGLFAEAGANLMLVARSNKNLEAVAEALRDKAKRTLTKHKERVRCFGYVLGGRGLRATMVRTAMNAVMMAMPFDAKIFDQVGPAVSWLAARPGQPAEVVASQDELRAAIEALL